MYDTSREINPYKELIVNNAEKIEPLMMQIEQWSILSNILNYVQHSRINSMNCTLDIKAVDKYKYRPHEDSREFKELDFGATSHKLQEEYMDIYEGIHSEVVGFNRFDENSDISTRDCCFKFLNRSVPIYPENEIVLKPNEQKLVKVKAPFVDEISGMAIIKILDGSTYSTLLIQLKATHNKALLDIVNKGKDAMIFKPGEMIGIIDLRSLGYYKIKQGILQQNLSRHYRFVRAEKLCEYFNKFVNTLKKEREQESLEDRYPWLDPEDDRRHMTDKEILEKYINLNNSCLNKQGKIKVMDMLYKYREAFSLRDGIGTCPKIKVEIDVTDKPPFFIRPYHIREEDKAFVNKEMKWLCYIGILKEGFSAYSSPVMLISRNLTKDKRVVTDFRHLNVRIAKNNLAYPLVRDTFSVLGNSKCGVLPVLDLKDAFHSLRLSENSKKYCGILPYFSSSSYLYERMPMRLNISPSI